MLGVAPDNRGLIPDSDAKRLAEFGAALREREANNLALHHRPTSLEVAAALDGDPDTFWSAPAGSHHSEIEVDFDKPVTFDHTLIMEWLNDGQHVEKYAIEIWDGKSSKWARVAEAQAIGHKKIDAFAPVTTDRVRLRILSSTAEAHIREFQIYHWGAPPTEKSAEK
jgi:alpha-L-fucosidase